MTSIAGLTILKMQQNQENRIIHIEDNYFNVLKVMGELGGDIKEQHRASEIFEVRIEVMDSKIDNFAAALGSKIDNVAAALGSKIDNVNAALGSKIDNVAAVLGSKIDKVVEPTTEKFDDLGNVVADLGSRIIRLEWQVGVIIVITGIFLTVILMPEIIKWLNEKVFRTSAVNHAQSASSSIALAPIAIVKLFR